MSTATAKVLKFESYMEELKRLTEEFHGADAKGREIRADRMLDLIKRIEPKDDPTFLCSYGALLACRPLV